MKLEHLVFNFDQFATEMANLKNKKHFDYLVTIVGEDFGEEEGLGCVYILENTETHERCSVKTLAKRVGDDFVIPTVIDLWKGANLLEREVFDFLGVKFLGHPDMRRLFLRSDFKGYPLRKDFKSDGSYTLEDDEEPDYGMEYNLNKDGELVGKQNKLYGADEYVINIGRYEPDVTVNFECPHWHRLVAEYCDFVLCAFAFLALRHVILLLSGLGLIVPCSALVSWPPALLPLPAGKCRFPQVFGLFPAFARSRHWMRHFSCPMPLRLLPLCCSHSRLHSSPHSYRTLPSTLCARLNISRRNTASHRRTGRGQASHSSLLPPFFSAFARLSSLSMLFAVSSVC